MNLKLIGQALLGISILAPLAVYLYVALSGSEAIQIELPLWALVLFIVYYVSLVVLGLIWLVLQIKATLTLKNELIKNEVHHLQSQINPHFFFNMLNNIYGTIDRDSELAKELVLKLSDLMRYSIYEGNNKRVPITSEIEFMQNYIDLNKMRYKKKMDIKFEVDLQNEGVEILPLVFIILLENAFKHGVENLRENAFVHMHLKADANQVDFEIQNNFDVREITKNGGIGLVNLKRRLNLVYPGNHTLKLTQEDAIYTAQLQLKL